MDLQPLAINTKNSWTKLKRARLPPPHDRGLLELKRNKDATLRHTKLFLNIKRLNFCPASFCGFLNAVLKINERLWSIVLNDFYL